MVPPPPLEEDVSVEREKATVFKTKFPLTAESAVKVIEQLPVVPLQTVALPDPSIHPPKVEPLFAVA
jgi:hypothetical protein